MYYQELVLLSVLVTRYSGRRVHLDSVQSIIFLNYRIEGSALLIGPVKDGAIVLV